MTAGQLRRRFDRFNRLYWDGKLAAPKLIIIPTGQQGTVLNGCSDWGGFTVSDGKPLIEIRAMSHWTFLSSTLLHEMIHEAIGVEHRHRGRKWNREVRRISKLGALIEVL